MTLQEAVLRRPGVAAGGRAGVLELPVRDAADGGQLRHPLPGHRLMLPLLQRSLRAPRRGHQAGEVRGEVQIILRLQHGESGSAEGESRQ